MIEHIALQGSIYIFVYLPRIVFIKNFWEPLNHSSDVSQADVNAKKLKVKKLLYTEKGPLCGASGILFHYIAFLL